MDAFKTEIAEGAGDVDPAKRTFPGAAFVATNKSGTFRVEGGFGSTTLDPNGPRFTLDSPLWIASCTKLVTSVAALQVVERGLVTLDEDITRVLPEWKGAKVLKGFDEQTEEPILVPSTKTMTLRHLLTHSAGMCYDEGNENARRYRKATGMPIGGGKSTLEAKTLLPLLFEPGEGFEYSTSVDWAGVVVQRLSGEASLESYMQKHIWGPLGMSLITFRPEAHPSILSRLVTMFSREPDGSLGEASYKGYPMGYDAGGGGLFTTAGEYIKLLAAILRKDSTLLSPASFEAMFTPQLPDPKYLEAYLAASPPEIRKACMNSLPPNAKVNWGLAGLLSLQDASGLRKKGSLSWGGRSNLFWWIDPSSEVCGIFASQILPLGDGPTVDLNEKFEKAVYMEINKGAA